MLKKIKTKTKKLITKIKKNKIKSALVLVVLLLIFRSFSSDNGEEVYITEKPSSDSLEQLVSVSGTVEANQKIDLRFQSSGKVSKLNFEIGDNVKVDSLIAELDNDIQQNSVNSALAQLSIANADLNLAYAGPTLEETQLSLIRIEEAEINYKNSQNNYEKILSSNEESLKVAQLQYDTALESFENAGFDLESTKESLTNTENISEINLNTSYSTAEGDIEDLFISNSDSISKIDDYSDIKNKLNTNYEEIFGEENKDKITLSSDLLNIARSLENLELDFSIYQLDPTNEALYQVLVELRDTTELLYDAASLIQNILNYNKNSDGELVDSEISSYQTTLELEITDISTALASINLLVDTVDLAEISYRESVLSLESGNDAADLEYNTLKNNLDIAESNLQTVLNQNDINANNAKLDMDLKDIYLRQAETNYNQLVADPRAVDVAGLKARVSQYNSNYERSLIQLDDTKIYAPTSGTITNIAMEVGENISAAENVVTIINDELQILANISETEVAKLNIGDPVRLTFDAFAIDKEYNGKVIKIDPAETVISGVIYYQTTIIFDEYDEAVKTGMTVNLEIITESIEETLQIPIQALNYDDDKIYVYILEGDEKVRQYVTTGVEGDYNIEILEGLSLNDDVIIYEKT